jgi:transposase
MDKKAKLPVTEQVMKVPVSFEGLKSGDKVAMMLGGSGDIFAGRLSIEGEKTGAQVFRIPPFVFSDLRLPGEKDKKEDHLALLRVFKDRPNLFYMIRPPDRALIRVKGKLQQRQEAQYQRIKRQQQIWHSLIGRVFLDEDKHYGDLEGEVADVYQQAQDDDSILQNLLAQEKAAEKDLKKAVRQLPIWDEIFKGIDGCGERIAAGIVASIADIRRFIAPNGAAKLKKFCSVHVMDDGRFPRQRHGEVCEGTPEARRALYLLADQFNRRPDSDWGKELLRRKLALREKHPEPVDVEVMEEGEGGKKVAKTVKRYTDGHIHKMAQWRTLTRFVEKLYKQWSRIENERSVA